MEKKKKKNKKWRRPRHTLVYFLLNMPFRLYCRIKYGARIERIKDSRKRPYLILYNHQTGFDQFFVGLTCKRPVYYLATEDIFSMGFLSRLIEYLVKPIPIKKQTNDPRAVINCIKVAKEGGTIAIAPEGNRTYSGQTCYIKPTIASLAKHLNLPIAFVKLDGGFGVQPRWSNKVRRGGMDVKIARILEPEEYKEMTDEELVELIREELWQDESFSERKHYSKALAEHIERAIYVCPECGVSEFESKGDVFGCKRCGLRVRYMPDNSIVGINKPLPFASVAEWYKYQEKTVNSLNPLEDTEKVIAKDKVSVYEVILYDRKKLISKDACITLYGDRLVLEFGGEVMSLSFEELSATAVLGKNKINIYHDKKVYQIKGAPDFCALKYVNIYYRSTYVKGGIENAEFLGL